MPGTIEGGRKAAATNKLKNGSDFYARIGAMGGKKSRSGGFASDKVGKDGLTGAERAREAGRKGGLISRRGPAHKQYEHRLGQIRTAGATVEASA